MKRPHAATAIAGGVLAALAGYSLMNSLTKREGRIHLTLLLLGAALLPLSFFVREELEK